MDTQPKIPTLKDSQKPQVKIRGLEAGMTLFDRLKQFKKKDLAFILAGLGTLFMAPLAEHFMMSPESADGQQLKQGWGGGAGGRGMFDGSGSSPYEPGTTGLAPGSAVGGGSDIITPLNVRDPSALVMGPGATQQPPTNSVMPATPPPTAPATHSDSDLKDALAASARGVGAAAHAAKQLLPVPKIALAGSGGLRGLGVVSGGTSASAGGGGPISSNGLVSNRAATGGGLGGVRAAPGYKGVARGQTGGDTTGMDALKKAAGNAADSFNRGPASTALDNSAAAGIPTNTGGQLGGGGAGGVGATDKPFGGDQNKDAKNVGESLAFLKQKAIQDAQIALWSKEQEAGDNRLEALKIRNSMAEAFTSKLAGSAADSVTCLFTGNAGSGCPSGTPGTTYACQETASQKVMIYPSGSVSTKGCSTPAGSSSGAPAQSTSYFYNTQTGVMNVCQGTTPTPIATNCSTTGGSPDPTQQSDDPHRGQNDPLNPIGSIPSASGSANLNQTCTDIANGYVKGPATEASKTNPLTVSLYQEARAMVVARDALYSDTPSGDCPNMPDGSTLLAPIDNGGHSIVSQLKAAIVATRGTTDADADNAIAQMLAATNQDQKDVKDMPDPLPGSEKLISAEKALSAVANALKAANTTIDGYKSGAPDAAAPDSTWGDAIKQAATKLQGELKPQHQSVSDAAAAAQKVFDNLGVAHTSLDLVVKGDAPTLKGVLQNKIDLKTQSGRADKDGVTAPKDPKAADVSKNANDPKPTNDSIAAANKAVSTDDTKVSVKVTTPAGAPPVSVSTGLKLALDDYEAYKKSVTTPDSAVVKQVATSYQAAVESGLTMQATQTKWLQDIRSAAPTANQIPAK